MQRFKASVTFEFDETPPKTFRQEVSAVKAASAARRVVVAAQKAHPNQRFRSLVILLERTT